MNKIKTFFDRYVVILVLYFLLALVLILFSVLFLDDIKAPSNMLIYNIFGTLALLGYWQSYQLTSKKLRWSLAIGKTRRQIYNRYLKRLALSLGLSSLLVVYYIFVFKWYVNRSFNYSNIIFLPIVTLFLSLLGFLEGLLRLNSKVALLVLILLFGGVIAIVLLLPIPYYGNLVVLAGAGLLVFVNRFVMLRIKV